MEKSEMLKALIAHYTNGNQARFAAMLGVKPQTVAAWLARNTFDVELIYAHCRDISGDWLLSGGSGPMFKQQQNVDVSDNHKIRELEFRIAAMSKTKEQQDKAYDIVMSMLDVVSKTYDFYSKSL